MDLNEPLDSQQNQHAYEHDRSALVAPVTGECPPHESYAPREHPPPNPASMGVPTNSNPFAMVQGSKGELVGEQQSSSQSIRIPGLRPNLDVDNRVFDERLNTQPGRGVQQQPSALPTNATFQTHMSPVAKRRCLSPPLPCRATNLRGKTPTDILQINTNHLQSFAHDNMSFRGWESTGQPALRMSSPPDKYGSKADVSPSAISTLFATDEASREGSFRQSAIQRNLMNFGRVEGVPNAASGRSTMMRQQTKFGDLQRRVEGEASDVNELMYRVQATPTFGSQSKMPALPLETSTSGLPDLFVSTNGQVDAYYGGETRQFIPQDPGPVTGNAVAEQIHAQRNASHSDARASATAQLLNTSETKNVDRLGIRIMTARA
ncbi:hypothetical protein BWQ96_08825 [Gracilariopsis chorda]|uniref:Uncharacterized protein n=1 Tax=Gracilariopsis chorda TaxID=448386 RepID=A0A2V3IH80_9FLOR|nr:hypothetical protein BWQ96_08825 [Gracilariopsis chorda]|eukprot:PXF41444.1 hypothetical protein BWQ96_08825 [Gracilariopsis chorda]